MKASLAEHDVNHELLGTCSLCGYRGIFGFENRQSVRSDYICASCGADLRHRDLAAVILDEFGRGLFTTITHLVRDARFRTTRIYEPSLKGPFVKHFNKIPKYTQSYFWPDVAFGDSRNGIQCQDLRALTYDDNSFDLIVSSDVFEHIFEPERAFEDIFRVLRRGGMHIFSIPITGRLRQERDPRRRDQRRGKASDLPPQYHVAGDGSRSLVVTDWGADIVDMLEAIGYRVSVVRRSAPLFPLHTNATFVARKP